MKKIKVKDQIETFIPENNVHFIILGTMAAANARIINDKDPGEVFFYHNPRNHFWRILTYIFEDEKKSLRSITEKKILLQKCGIAMANIVDHAYLEEDDKDRPDDSLLFKAYQLGELEVKTISEEFKNLLATKPIYFTRKSDKKLIAILEDYFLHNGLDKTLVQKIHFVVTPTRGTPELKAENWKSEGIKKVA